VSPPAAPVAKTSLNAPGEASIGAYLAELERIGLIDVETGTRDTLTRELAAAERLLHQGASMDAAIALYAIVESPRFKGFEDFVEYQNAEYDLAVSLATSGAYDSALHYLERVLGRGPGTLYFAPAHRRAVDIALEIRDYHGVLGRLERIRLAQPLPTEASGERAYLRARVAYSRGDFATAERELASISRKSRLFSSALYLRGVMRTRQGKFAAAAEALCEIVDTPDDDKFTFVVDDRYFTIKDLARLGLGRIAHEQAEYDDAYYHYFQIPDDSDRLPEALFEAAWSMYQKRELTTARDLVSEFLKNFPTSPLRPEAKLLAGYIDLADCKFEDAQVHYDELVAELTPVVAEMKRIIASPERRSTLFASALERRQAERANPDQRLDVQARRPVDRVLGLLRLDPSFVRLHDAMRGFRRAAGDAPHVVRAWTSLGRRARQTKVGAVAAGASAEQEDAADINGLIEDIRRLRDEVARAQSELVRGQREGTLPRNAASEEKERLRALERDIDTLEERAAAAAERLDAALESGAAGGVAPMLRADLKRARALDRASRTLLGRLGKAADDLAASALERLYRDTRRVLDKARLGKIDAVIGQKDKLDIEVQDLAAGRWPAELHGRLWEQGLIGDDEEYWPFEGEFWADEYEGWR
jgi:TolA-binding protein